MDPVTIGLLAGAGMGLLENSEKQKEAERNRNLQAAMMLTSPWTGMKPDLSGLQAPSAMGSVAKGALTGALMGKQFKDDGTNVGGEATTQTTNPNFGFSPWLQPAGYYPQQRGY